MLKSSVVLSGVPASRGGGTVDPFSVMGSGSFGCWSRPRPPLDGPLPDQLENKGRVFTAEKPSHSQALKVQLASSRFEAAGLGRDTERAQTVRAPIFFNRPRRLNRGAAAGSAQAASHRFEASGKLEGIELDGAA